MGETSQAGQEAELHVMSCEIQQAEFRRHSIGVPALRSTTILTEHCENYCQDRLIRIANNTREIEIADFGLKPRLYSPIMLNYPLPPESGLVAGRFPGCFFWRGDKNL